jgi:hypothetical protein
VQAQGEQVRPEGTPTLKKKLKKVENLRPRKSDRQRTNFHQPFTTNKPQKHHVKTPEFLKTPCKNAPRTTSEKILSIPHMG